MTTDERIDRIERVLMDFGNVLVDLFVAFKGLIPRVAAEAREWGWLEEMEDVEAFAAEMAKALLEEEETFPPG